ncbi:hypothetical protein FV139_13835 [Parahaliea maris]|uniref:Uncharacterized protein n=1 Tax=Parahaliea maris TaxID=2716870 RepID=A0A5C8ZX30_9GAMM|nr:hypothetical protein [Parahaliea maris]TXS93026.1 hypothetical protein FV139_13835 [Parahaliea maris]
MSQPARWLGLALTLAMFVFSSWMYLQTGDWVALVFAGGSFGYALFFMAAANRKQGKESP